MSKCLKCRWLCTILKPKSWRDVACAFCLKHWNTSCLLECPPNSIFKNSCKTWQHKWTKMTSHLQPSTGVNLPSLLLLYPQGCTNMTSSDLAVWGQRGGFKQRRMLLFKGVNASASSQSSSKSPSSYSSSCKFTYQTCCLQTEPSKGTKISNIRCGRPLSSSLGASLWQWAAKASWRMCVQTAGTKGDRLKLENISISVTWIFDHHRSPSETTQKHLSTCSLAWHIFWEICKITLAPNFKWHTSPVSTV